MMTGNVRNEPSGGKWAPLQLQIACRALGGHRGEPRTARAVLDWLKLVELEIELQVRR